MADCECLAKCPFFNDRMPDVDGLGAMFKRRYCQGDNQNCARYQVLKKAGRDKVPPTLYPNQMEIARKIIAAA